eukprot:scaffold149431_cov36-Cyclotella_meneghiniana.AAC.3
MNGIPCPRCCLRRVENIGIFIWPGGPQTSTGQMVNITSNDISGVAPVQMKIVIGECHIGGSGIRALPRSCEWSGL